MVKRLAIGTRDGRTLAARLYTKAAPVGSVVLHGATAVPQTFYEPFATQLAELGFAVLTYDYRGVGGSADRPRRDDPVTMRDWIDDATAAQAWLAAQTPEAPLMAIGHSFGGQIAASLEGVRPADALVLVASQSGYWRLFPRDRARLWMTWKLGIPALTSALGYLPHWAGLGESLPSGVARQWARWCLSSDYLLSELPELRARMAAFEGRMLALSFTDDAFASLDSVQWLVDKHVSAAIEHHHLEPSTVGLPAVGHFGFFRRSSRAALWPLVAAFLLDATRRRATGSALESTLWREIMADLEYGR